MSETTENRRRFIINAAYFAIVLTLIVLTAKYVVPWLLPFLLGYAIAMLFKPVVRWITRHSKVGEKFAGCIVLLLAYVLIGALLFLGGYKLVVQLNILFTNLPNLGTNVIGPAINSLSEFLFDTLGRIFPDIAQSSSEALSVTLQDLQSTLISISTTMVTSIGGLTSKIPSFLLSFFFTIMSSLIISMNYQEITSYVVCQVPEKYRTLIFRVKDEALSTVGKYLIAYLKIMSITFVELAVGLTVLGIKNSVPVALVIALFDALPILGTGGIMVPWAVITLLGGNLPLALGLAIVYALVTVIRNIVEPRIIGNQLGLHPLVTLIAIYIGFRLIGILGMILFPILVQILMSLHRAGIIKSWR